MTKAFCIAFLFVFSSYLYSDNAPKVSQTSEDDANQGAAPNLQGYTINYNTVSIIEYIRFASKICNVNFIFDEADLDFTVTVVSDAPITSQNVMATLLQVLRIHGLSLLEQDNNLVIHKSPGVMQLATIVTKSDQAKNAPIVTRIFRVKEAKVDAIAGVIRPMISAAALLELLPETKQMVLTDVKANVDKVASLIEILDSPLNQLSVKTYTTVHNTPDHLVALASQIMTPLTQGNPFILVPQPMTGAIFIVSTEDLINKTVAILNSLDVPPKKEFLTQKVLKGENIFVYKAVNRPSDEILRSLVNIAENLQKSGIPEGDLINTMESARLIKETNSITFIGSKDSIAKVKEFLASLDVPGKETPSIKSSFFVYRPKNRSAKEIDSALREMADHLKNVKGEESLVHVIQGAKINNTTNTLLFYGDENQFGRIKDLLAEIDTPTGKKAPSSKNDFFLYKIQHVTYEDLNASLKAFVKNLEKSNTQEEELVQTIDEMKPIPETNSILFTGPESALKRLQELIPAFDSKNAMIPISNQFLVYKPKYLKGDQFAKSLQEVTADLKSEQFRDPAFLHALESMNYVKSNGSFLFTGDAGSVKRLEELISTIDVPTSTKAVKKTFWLYHPQFVSREKAETYFKQLAASLNKDSEADLIETIRSMKWIDASHSFLFQGTEPSITRLNDLIKTFDISSASQQRNFALYPLQYASQAKANQYLDQLTGNLVKEGSEKDLIEAIRSRKWIEDSHSFMFQGTDASLNRIQELLKAFDTPSLQTQHKSFALYPLQYASQQNADQYLDQLADSLSKVEHEKDLVETLRSRKWIENSHSYMFQGSETSLNRVKDLLKGFDIPSAAQNKNFILVPLQYAPLAKANQYLDQLEGNLSKEEGEKDLADAIRSRKWIADSHSFMFNGSLKTLDRIKEVMAALDTPESKVAKPGYYIYKLQHVPGDVVEEELDALAKNLKASGLSDDKVLSVIQNIRYVKETNSLLLTGDPAAIEQVKTMIAEYDHPRPAAKPISSNFFMYKPKYLTAAQIEKSLNDIAANLKKAGLADPALLYAIDSAKYVETTNSIIFTGNADSIQKIQALLAEIDTPPKEHSPIQHIGKTTFLLYKLKVASGPQIVTSIKAMTADLKKAGNADPELLQALNTMKYVKETNSLFFTGQEEALKKVQSLVEQFDVTSLAAPTIEKPILTGQPNFYLYKPVSLPAPQLEKLIQDFAENVRSSGLNDPDLFAAISSMRLVEATQSLVFTGTPKALDQIKELLKSFDIPSNLANKPESAPLEPSIQAIDNTSFLVYKLQFHKGDEIQSALKQIAKDLINNNAPINRNLLNSINSIQWLDVTNSLLCSGDQETLTRLKELIKNLDIPLKQVFIEILVIETTLSNALLFGLEWGGNYKFNDKFGISSFNTVPPASIQSTFPDTFVSKLSGLIPPSPPTPVGNIPPVTGFDLGVIGEVIKHNGSTFLTLGSLLNALQSDTETTIITAPKILGQDGRTSTIFSGANIPFTGSFVNNTTTGATILTSNIEYRDIGLNLTITPVLGNSDIVTLDINLDRSQTATDITGQSQLNFQSQTANGIITSKTTMTTTVHVPDRNFLVLSGFVNNSNTKVKQGIPCLGGLPMIGAAFSQQNDTISNQNVVIFLRPFIINSIDDMRRVTSEQEDFFRDLANTPFLEFNYDNAVELIKSIDDE